MPVFSTPGVYIVEKPPLRTIQPVGTNTPAFLGLAPAADAYLNQAVPVNNWHGCFRSPERR